MGRAFPDALDLLLICAESGMSIEHALRKVAQEIGIQSVALAEELSLTTAELSFLPERRSAFENLGIRTGLDSIKQIVTVLIQAERYGTPLGTALRVVAQEGRNQRMMLANRTDDIVLSSRALRDHHDAGSHSNQPDRRLLIGGRDTNNLLSRFWQLGTVKMARSALHSLRSACNDNEKLAVS
jgi:Flp pilus assembly protein TadB